MINLRLISIIKLGSLVILIVTVAAMIYLKFYSYIFLILFAIIGVSLSIIFNSRNDLDIAAISFNNQYKNYTAYSILFFISLALLYISLLQGIYTKTILFYILFSFCVGLLGLEIILFEGNPLFTLAKISILCLSLLISNQIVYPFGIGGSDSSSHFATIQAILDIGHILPQYVYAFLPNHHLLIAISSEVSSLEFKKLYYSIAAFGMSLNIPILFIIGRKFVSQQFGLICALNYLSLDYVLYWSSHAAQLSFYLPLLCFIFWLMLYRSIMRDIGYSVTSLVIIVSLIFTHHYSCAILLLLSLLFMLACGFSSSDCLLCRANRIKDSNYKSLIIFLFVALFAHWMYYSSIINMFSGNLIQYFSIIGHLASRENSAIATSSQYDGLPIKSIFLNTFGASLLIMLSIFGLFYKKSSFLIYISKSWFILSSIFIGAGIFFQFRYLLPNRIYIFLQLFGLIFLASLTLTVLIRRSTKYSILLYLLLLMLISLFSNASTIAGFETSLFAGGQPYIKLYETPQEIFAEKWEEYYIPANMTMYPSKSIYPSSSNSPYRKASNHIVKMYQIIAAKNIINVSNLDYNSFILFSDYDISAGFLYSGSRNTLVGSAKLIKINGSQYNVFACNNQLNLIYDNKIIHAYSKL